MENKTPLRSEINDKMNDVNRQLRLLNMIGEEKYIKYHKFEQPYDSERFATSEQSMEEQYNSRGI